MKVGDKVVIFEETYDYGILEHEGEITQITTAFIETKHYRSPVKYPQYNSYVRAYCDTWTKHYFNPDNDFTKNFKLI